MNYKINVQCTKEHLEKAKYCSLSGVWNDEVGSSCWVAVAVRDIFPTCWVSTKRITDVIPYSFIGGESPLLWEINLPLEAITNINKFDDCRTIEKREALEPFSFDIEFDQQTFETILQCNGFKCQQDFEGVIKKTNHLKFEVCAT